MPQGLDAFIRSLKIDDYPSRKDIYKNIHARKNNPESGIHHLLREATFLCDTLLRNEFPPIISLLRRWEQMDSSGPGGRQSIQSPNGSSHTRQIVFESKILEMYSSFDDEVLFALTVLLNENTNPCINEKKHSFVFSCMQILGESHVELIEFIANNPERILYSLITDFLRLDIHQYHKSEQGKSLPTLYFCPSRRGAAKEDKFTLMLIEKARKLQSKEDAVMLFTKGFEDSRSAIPLGSVLRDFRKYIKLDLPLSGPMDYEPTALRSIFSSLPQWSHKVFGNISELNIVQSKVFPMAFQSDDNLLISAATGCGKTLIAILVILRSLQRCYAIQESNLDALRVVYLVPMKALAAQIVANFKQCLGFLGLKVKEFTGDMSLNRHELGQCNIIVATPEKWDVVTRKFSGFDLLDGLLTLIIDECHLLNEDRGPVIEALVARSFMQKEISGSAPRIVGLSATLPNPLDVSKFMGVDSERGLFIFGEKYRPVPLQQTYVGIKEKLSLANKSETTNLTMCECVIETLSQSKQVLVFVHARNKTMVMAKFICDQLKKRGIAELLREKSSDIETQRKIRLLKTSEIRELISQGVGIHHAGMLRTERAIIESLFKSKNIQVLVCTATLAWGMNLPAHTVIIHGTCIYDPKYGGYVDMSPLDVVQIFGRAGRPGYDTSGHGIIITSEEKVKYYVRMLSNSTSIESNMLKELPNHLNAEIVSMRVRSISDAMKWFGHLYLWYRVQTNPFLYGITVQQFREDRNLYHFRIDHITRAFAKLQSCEMIRYDRATYLVHPTEIGRIASHYYISVESIVSFNDITIGPKNKKRQFNDDEDLLCLIASSQEFQQLRIRPEEEEEIEKHKNDLPFALRCGKSEIMCSSAQMKVILLIKFYVARINLHAHSLISDTSYIIENAERVCRAFFEMEVYRQHSESALKLLGIAKCISKRCWNGVSSPLMQFEADVPTYIIDRIERKMPSVDEILDLSASEIGDMVQSRSYGVVLKRLLHYFPRVKVNVQAMPIAQKMIRVCVKVTPLYTWSDKYHGTSDVWWILVRHLASDTLVHNEYFSFTKSKLLQHENVEICFSVPISGGHDHYDLVVENTLWIGSRQQEELKLDDCNTDLGPNYTTQILPLTPLDINAVSSKFHQIYPYKVFNTVQTHCFHALYHTDEDIFLGAPTGSGKTMCAEFAILRVLQQSFHDTKIVYVAPLKALVRERVIEWRKRFFELLQIPVIELTGDLTPTAHDLQKGKIICTTPEKWDGISRSWPHRKYVRSVSLLIIDEIHMLNTDRGPTIEMITVRTKVMGETRVVALSTSVANVDDLARWLGVRKKWAMFNFDPSARPVPMRCFISGFPGRAYCHRMALMNKPVYEAIVEKSLSKPVIVFVSSRRQTRLTALALITMLFTDQRPNILASMEDTEWKETTMCVSDTHLRHVLHYGIGIHHGGLCESDRILVEQLFKNRRLHVIVATSTLAWGVNFPAHMVIVKGTEYFDASQKRYVDVPITDILQMIGRAGRPQYDKEGVALVLTNESRREFYKRFLYNSFPIESYLPNSFIPHINAEISNGTIRSCGDMVEFFTWTFLFQRMIKNPLYYGIQNSKNQTISTYLSDLVYLAVTELCYCFCIQEIPSTDDSLVSTHFGRLCAYYYLSHLTMRRFVLDLGHSISPKDILYCLSMAEEFSQVPVRHNEDALNLELSKKVPIEINISTIDSPHTKAYLLFQAHIERLELPISDYITDTTNIISNSARIIQSMISVAACQGYLRAVFNIILVWKSIAQCRWWYENTLLQVPNCRTEMLEPFQKEGIFHIKDLLNDSHSLNRFSSVMSHPKYGLTRNQIEESLETVRKLPRFTVSISLHGHHKFSVFCSAHRKITHRPSILHVCSRNLPASVSEAFWAVIGDSRKNELIALKHIQFIGQKIDFVLNFDWNRDWEKHCSKTEEGSLVYPLEFHLICGSYFGIDCSKVIKVVHINTL